MSEGSFASLMAPVGPRAEAFVNDQRFITAIMGPYGSAKTTSCIRKIVNSAFWQEPGPDGVRRVRWCCVRDTYAQLEANVMNSWFTWFPKTKANWNGREMCHRLRFATAGLDGQPAGEIYIEMYFRAMGDQKAEDVLKGFELTGLWLNETDTLDGSVLLFGLPRTGRYPSAKDGGCQWRGVICDFNAPDIDNWTYDLLVEGKIGLTPDQLEEFGKELGPRFGIGFHRQPGGLSKDPRPENIDNLPKGYYETLMLGFGGNDNHVRRFVHNEFGAVRNGQPVFPEFNEAIHLAKEELKADPNLPIHAGLDGGRTPAMIFVQSDPVTGQLRVLDELVLYDPLKKDELQRLGPTAMGQIAREFVARRYPRCKMGTVFYDPSIDFGVEEDGYDWLRFFKKEFPAKFRPGGKAGNRLEPRHESVRKRLNQTPGGKPAFLLSPSCRVLRRAFNNGYVMERVKFSNGSGRFRDKPVKNDFSHPMDALMEATLGIETKASILDDMDMRQRARGPKGKVSYGGYAGAGRVQ